MPQPPTLADMSAAPDMTRFLRQVAPHAKPVATNRIRLSRDAVDVGDGPLDDWHGPYYGFRYVDLTKGHGERPYQTGHYRPGYSANTQGSLQVASGGPEDQDRCVPGLGDLYIPFCQSQLELHHISVVGGSIV